MSGEFSRWQPVYGSAGIPTFPVDMDCKKPLVGNYLRAGLKASRSWARKFPNANGIGFACGAKSRITVVDVDTTDEQVLAEALACFGETPIIIGTASGKFHCWYSHNGEPRLIRKAMAGKPIDLLGAGFAIAPYSKGKKGDYSFLQGSLGDLPLIPKIKTRFADEEEGLDASDACGDIKSGERNNELFRILMAKAREVQSLDDLTAIALGLNSDRVEKPLSGAELSKLVGNVWDYEERGENFIGSAGYITLSRDRMALAMAHGSDAYMLYCILQHHHWKRREFCVANAMAQNMPDRSWTRKRFAAARSALVRCGLLEMLQKPSLENGAAIYRFGQKPLWGKERERGVSYIGGRNRP